MHSNVVALHHAAEIVEATLPLTSASPGVQRAVVAWADLRGAGDHSVLQFIEQPNLMTEHSLLYQHDGTSPVERFAGAGISGLHRSIAERLLAGPLPVTPKARSHIPASRREMLSVVLPFMEYDGFVIVLFENG